MCVRVFVCVCVCVCACAGKHAYLSTYIKFTICFCVHKLCQYEVVYPCASYCVCVCLSVHMQYGRVRARVYLYVGCVSAELLTQTGHEKGTLDCCLCTAAATRPAATRLAAIKNTLHKPGVKEIFRCVTHNLKAFLRFYEPALPTGV